MDAMGCQKEIIKRLREKKADYLLPLKANHENFYLGLKAWHAAVKINHWTGIDYHSAAKLENGHGCHQQRQLWPIPVSELIDNPPVYQELRKWKDVKTVVVIYQ